jgi:hypothetical protein
MSGSLPLPTEADKLVSFWAQKTILWPKDTLGAPQRAVFQIHLMCHQTERGLTSLENLTKIHQLNVIQSSGHNYNIFL